MSLMGLAKPSLTISSHMLDLIFLKLKKKQTWTENKNIVKNDNARHLSHNEVNEGTK